MKIEEAKKAGALAFLDGKGRAPALNAEFTKAACADKENILALLGAYLTGWDYANLASDAPFPDMPSIAEFNKIMEAA